MSVPMPATGDGSPAPGYYPDPSIPGYVRYWNGAAWVPGTSRPAPSEGAAVPVAGTRPAPTAPTPRAPAAPTPPAPAVVDETGPVFFDEEPWADPVQEPASAWQADVSRQTGFGGERDHRVSWGAPGQQAPRLPDPAPAQPPASAVRTGDPRPLTDGAVEIRATHRAAGPGQESGGLGTRPGRSPEAAGEAGGPAALRAQSEAGAPARPQLPAQPSRPTQASRPTQPNRPSSPGPVRADAPVLPWKPPAEEPFAQVAARPGGLGKRFLARLIDTVVLALLVGPPAGAVLSRIRAHIDEKVDAAERTGRTVTVWLLDGTTAGYIGGVIAVLLLLGVLYEVLPTAKWGRTLGKTLCGLEVRGIETHALPGFGAALRRWLVYGVLGILAVGVFNVLWCLVDRPWRQCWHDKVARTFVARRVRH